MTSFILPTFCKHVRSAKIFSYFARMVVEERCNLLPSTVTICGLFENDAVSLKRNGQFRCGVIANSSEDVSSDDEDFDDDISNDDKLRRGKVRVAWHPEATAEVLNENTVSITRPNFDLGSSVQPLPWKLILTGSLGDQCN